jgi:predicted nucleic acid-binding protein
MIVIDASALVDWLLGTPRGPAVADHMRGPGFPHTLDFAHLEVLSAFRTGLSAGRLVAERAELAVDDLVATPLELHSAAPFASRVWELRGTHTPYDAAYVALAEALRAPLVTTDRRLARSKGHRATIIEARVERRK